ncbi:GTP-binding protein [Prauserella marina]|uniref:Dynamin family protein n=1 Tax=Prauserella marina TaxID=530584 RepID=A0A222VX35_9PSEU|nr:dynamin family protein [Prauserella marina]ASR38477.1 GTP-binding protein [Prauserella marina]PWV78278.1 dynamin family protein [Prauserella marina]SDC82435.1 Dynamin family protein [Prauserella marina]
MKTPCIDLLDEAIQACATHERQDLAGRLTTRRAELSGPTVRALVVGESGKGKSQLINGLLNAPVCAVGDDVTTAVPAVIAHAEKPVADLVSAGSADPVLAIEGPGRSATEVESATALANRAADVARVEIGLPRELLRTGLTLVDTPPFGPSATRHVANTLAALPQADAVLLVTDATRELSGTELELLGAVLRSCPTVMVVLTKIDLVPDWRAVAERNKARLARDGLPAAVLPVSATLRLAAARTGDAKLNEESGYGALVRYLHQDLMGHVELLRRRSVSALIDGTVRQLVVPLRHTLEELRQGSTEELTARWRAAGRKAEELQREAARWQTVLADEVADLTADLDFDLRERTRQILREADEYFDVADPAKDWDEFGAWLKVNLTSVAETNSAWLLDRFEWIARKLARQVAPRDDAIPESLLAGGPRDHVGNLRMPNVERFGIGQKLFVGMRGSYSGLLMFGLATTLAGMPLINPISLGAGAAFGAKSVFEERGNRLKRRQATAKTTAHRYVDDFFLTYGKESKDTVRKIHRELRDRCTALAQDLRAEITETAQRIKQVIDTETTERGNKAREATRGLEELDLLHRRARALAPTAARGLTA